MTELELHEMRNKEMQRRDATIKAAEELVTCLRAEDTPDPEEVGCLLGNIMLAAGLRPEGDEVFRFALVQ